MVPMGRGIQTTFITCPIFIQYRKMSETGQKLVLTHRFVVLKIGLENNWMQKLNHMNRSKGQLNINTISQAYLQ